MTGNTWPSIKALEAEERGDWSRARMWWFYAAQELSGNPRGLRTEYCEREDAAAERARSPSPSPTVTAPVAG